MALFQLHEPVGNIPLHPDLHPASYSFCYEWNNAFQSIIAGSYRFQTPLVGARTLLVKTQKGFYQMETTAQGTPCCEELFIRKDGKALLMRSRFGFSYDTSGLKRHFDATTEANAKRFKNEFRTGAREAIEKAADRKARADTQEHFNAWSAALESTIGRPLPFLEDYEEEPLLIASHGKEVIKKSDNVRRDSLQEVMSEGLEDPGDVPLPPSQASTAAGLFP
eukprot:161605_1